MSCSNLKKQYWFLEASEILEHHDFESLEYPFSSDFRTMLSPKALHKGKKLKY